MAFKVRIADEETIRKIYMENLRKGPIRFVLFGGLLKFGLPMFVFFTFYQYVVIGYHNSITLAGLKTTAWISLGAGLVFGIAMWFTMKRKLTLLQSKKS